MIDWSWIGTGKILIAALAIWAVWRALWKPFSTKAVERIGEIVATKVMNAEVLKQAQEKAHAEETGRRLATHEDVENVLHEIKLVTKETEAIKAQISGDLWKQQWKLDRKREAYGNLIATAHQVNDHLMRLAPLRLFAEANPEARASFNQILYDLMEHRNKMVLAIGVASIFSEHKDAAAILNGFAETYAQDNNNFHRAQQTLQLQIAKVISAAREEFGMTDVPLA